MPNLNEKLTNETVFNVENVNFNNTYEYGMLKELTDIKEYFIQQAKEAEKLHAEFFLLKQISIFQTSCIVFGLYEKRKRIYSCK